MSAESLPSPAPPTTRQEILAERVELEVACLRAARPELEARIDRAASILVMQLSSPAHQRPIRVRVGKGGMHFLVASSSAAGAVYVVDPRSFECSCPDHHRHRAAACKHGIAAWILSKVAAVRGCRSCIDGFVYMTAEVVDSAGEVIESVDKIRCKRCGGPR